MGSTSSRRRVVGWRSAAVVLGAVVSVLGFVSGCGDPEPDPSAALPTARSYVTALNDRNADALARLAVREQGASDEDQAGRVERELTAFGGRGIDPSAVEVAVGDVSPVAASLRFTVSGAEQVRAMEWHDGAWRVGLRAR